jgi:hypothetical protein
MSGGHSFLLFFWLTGICWRKAKEIGPTIRDGALSFFERHNVEFVGKKVKK